MAEKRVTLEVKNALGATFLVYVPLSEAETRIKRLREKGLTVNYVSRKLRSWKQ